MKKILLGVALSVAVLQGCRKDDDNEEETVQLTVDEQKEYDDAAITDFLNTHYLDSKGLVTAFDDTTDADNNQKKLADYENLVKLPSGVVYLVRPGAQPDPGKTIGSNDVISFFQSTKMYLSAKVNDKIVFNNAATFVDNVNGNNNVPTIDPGYYYIKESAIADYNKANNTTVGRDFFEIEGLREALPFFKSYDNLSTAEDYNLQGVIIVPSRAAFGRDNSYYGSSLTNRSFVFNFQVYNTKARDMASEN